MEKLRSSDGNSGLSNRTRSNDEFFLNSDATRIDFIPITGLDPSSRDVIIDSYDSDEGTTLDAVLANVHRMMDCLPDEEFDAASLTSSNFFTTEAQNVKPPKSVDDLIFELCGDAGLKEANAASGGQSEGNGDINKQFEKTKIARKNEITETHLLSGAQAIADESAQEAESNNFRVDENNIKLNLLNKQVSSLENLQVAPSLETISVNQAKKPLIRENGNKGAAPNESDNWKLKIEIKDKSTTSKARLNIFKSGKSETDECLSEHVAKCSDQQQQMQRPKSIMQQLRQPQKEKKKQSANLGFPDKTSSIRHVISNGKRKTSSSKEPKDIKQNPTVNSNCSCFNLQEDNASSRLRNNSVYQLQSSKNVPDEKVTNKTDKTTGGTSKKNFWTREKKRGLSLLRSPSTEERNILEQQELELATDKRINENKAILLNSVERKLTVDYLHTPNELRSRSTGKNAKYSSACLEDYNCAETNQKKRTSASPRLIRKFRINFPHPHPVKHLTPTENKKAFPRVDSEPKLLHSCAKEFEAPAESLKQRRATMDSATTRSKVLDIYAHRKKSLKDDRERHHVSLPLKLQLAINQVPESLASRFGASFDSDGSPQGSKDSLEDDDGLPKRNGNTRQNRMKATLDMDEHQVEFLRRKTSTKTKKNLLRKSMRYGGKSTSTPACDGDDMAERIWLPEGDCSWRNLSGERVGLESTKLQSLSELECDALRKVSLSRLNDADLGVSITVPKDESKVLDRKVSLKKRYAVHLSSKEKNKDKNFDHVFGIPLVNVVENDQLLRLQKSASFAPCLDYQQHNDQFDVSSRVLQGATSDPPSNSSSSSGSTTSISNHTAASHEEKSTFNHKPNKSPSEQNESNEEVSKQNEIESVFNNGENSNSNQSQIPTSARSPGATTAQPLRRRGAIAASSINEIDPFQSQLLEALSLSVSGSATHSQKKEKKRSLLPPTMMQVPYVVQKCCDHLQKYGLSQAGIFRVPGSKKRVKQLREQFDRGIDVTIDETYNPHDVAALLKEFFRDLPESLLTRELYPAFLQTTKISKQQERLACLRYLVWLLPLTHRDTLQTLLQFLALVAAHAEDTCDAAGNKVLGNKMTVSNLATIFGPNILHRFKKSSSNGDGHHFQVQGVEKPEESSAVIKVIEDVISNQLLLFQIPKEEHNQMLRILKDSDPEAVDFLLRRKAANHMREKSRLLGNHSSPNSSKSFPQRHPVGFCEQLPVVSFQSDSDSELADRTEGSRTGHSDTSKSAVMRLSYQQATGHVMIPSQDEKHEKGSFSKFKRPFFKKSKSHPSNTSEVEHPVELDEEGGNEMHDITNAMTQLNSGLEKIDVSSLLEEDTSPAFMWSAKSSHRSMSFTDDDMEAILGGKSANGSVREFSATEVSNPEKDFFEDQNSLKQLSDLENENDKSPSTSNPPTDEVRFEDEPDRVIRAANSSDSGVYVESSKMLVNSASDWIQRRGGFSLNASPQTEVACGDLSSTSFILSSKNSLEELEAADVDHVATDVDQSQANFEKRKDSVLENSSESSGEIDDHETTDSSHALIENFSEKLNVQKSDVSSENHCKQIHSIDKNNENISMDTASTISDNHQFHASGHINQKSPVLESATKTSASTDFNQIHEIHQASSLSSVQNVAAPLPQSKPKSTESTGLRPKLQRQYTLITSLKEGEPDQELPKFVKQEKFLSEKANMVIKSPKRVVTQRGVNVAKLAGRYNKDDKPAEPKSVPGSKWTSPGLIGGSPKLHNSRKEASTLKDKKYQTPLNNNSLPPWHAAVKDRTTLPETLV